MENVIKEYNEIGENLLKFIIKKVLFRNKLSSFITVGVAVYFYFKFQSEIHNMINEVIMYIDGNTRNSFLRR